MNTDKAFASNGFIRVFRVDPRQKAFHPSARPKSPKNPRRGSGPMNADKAFASDSLIRVFRVDPRQKAFPSIRSPEKPEKSPARIRADEHG